MKQDTYAEVVMDESNADDIEVTVASDEDGDDTEAEEEELDVESKDSDSKHSNNTVNQEEQNNLPGQPAIHDGMEQDTYAEVVMDESKADDIEVTVASDEDGDDTEEEEEELDVESKDSDSKHSNKTVNQEEGDASQEETEEQVKTKTKTEDEEDLSPTGSVRKKRGRKKAISIAEMTKKKHGVPRVKSLEIPFRAIKRTMKLDDNIATVQIEAAIICTYAVELFIQKLVTESHKNAKKRGRNTIRYEDIGEVRASNDNLDFLDSFFP